MKTLTKTPNKLLLYVLTAFVALCTLASCEKDDAQPDSQTGAVPTPEFPKPSDADVVLVAVHSSVPSPIQMPSIPGMPTSTDITMDYGLGIALFKDGGRAGKVLLNNTELTFTNGVYTWIPNLTNITDPTSVTGINLNSSVNWNITSPDIQKTLGNIPGKPRITSGKTINRSQGYTLTNQFASSAQKVLYGVYANNKYVLKEMGAGSTQVNFTAAELADLGTTKNGMIQANAYIITDEVINGKKVYFVRQSSYTVTGVEIN